MGKCWAVKSNLARRQRRAKLSRHATIITHKNDSVCKINYTVRRRVCTTVRGDDMSSSNTINADDILIYSKENDEQSVLVINLLCILGMEVLISADNYSACLKSQPS